MHSTLQHALAVPAAVSYVYNTVFFASGFMQQEKVWQKKNAKIVLKLGWPVHKPFPFGLGKLDEESKTSLNVPFELAFMPIKD